ncbi:MAG TPA: HAD-IIB family hydrolase [Burkholderiales bacterium]|jgi:HAD superfamily hydrolase (TIGR01484 family)|nr:HAD-IIB family hydrolase [Burkholderiales bacterium]
MLPLDRLDRAALAQVRGVFADIDDTLTTDGRLTAEAYAAMAALHGAGLLVVPITGRPAGWCDHIARMWPVDAVVGENGAFYFCYDRAARKLVKRFRDDDATRAANRARLAAVRERILAEVPGTALASDQLYREADLAIDWREDVPPLADEAVDRIVAIMRAAGMTAKVSSIHVNGWFGVYDKLGMTKTLMHERFGVELDAARGRYAFVGDSPNDAPMFAYFPLSVGVANVRRFAGRLERAPAYVTAAESGKGFAEFAAQLLAARA